MRSEETARKLASYKIVVAVFYLWGRVAFFIEIPEERLHPKVKPDDWKESFGKEEPSDENYAVDSGYNEKWSSEEIMIYVMFVIKSCRASQNKYFTDELRMGDQIERGTGLGYY